MGSMRGVSKGFTVLGPLAFGAGASFDLSGIPAGSTRVVVSFDGLSGSVMGMTFTMRLGGAAVQADGYLAAVQDVASLSSVISGVAFPMGNWSSTDVLKGTFTLELHDSATDVWNVSSIIIGNGKYYVGLGTVKLPDDLAFVRFITSVGVFDAGSVTIKYS